MIDPMNCTITPVPYEDPEIAIQKLLGRMRILAQADYFPHLQEGSEFRKDQDAYFRTIKEWSDQQ